MRGKSLALCALLALLSTAGWVAARAQEAPSPGEPGYFDAKIALLLAAPAVDQAPDQMFQLLSFLWADSMVRAGNLLQSGGLVTDQRLQSQLIAETGVLEAVYRAASELPPVSDPALAPLQADATEAMRLSVIGSTSIRDYVMTGNEAHINEAMPIFEAVNGLMAPYGAMVEVDLRD